MDKVDNTLRPISYLRMGRHPIPEFCVIRMLSFSQTMERAHLEYHDNNDDDHHDHDDNNNYKAPMTLNFRTTLLINNETSKICLTYKVMTC